MKGFTQKENIQFFQLLSLAQHIGGCVELERRKEEEILDKESN